MRDRHLTLGLFLLAETLAFFAIGANNVVLPWLILSRTGDATVTGMLYMITTVPLVFASLSGGELIDRLGRRRISVIADLGSAVSVAALVVVDQAVGLTVPWFIALGVLASFFRPPGMTARQALIADVAEASGTPLEKVASWRQGAYGAAFLAGPGVAGVLLAVLDTDTALWVIAGCHALSAVCIGAMPLVQRAARAVAATRPLEAWREVRADRTLRAIFLIGFAIELLAAPLVTMILPAHYEALDQPDLFGATVAGYAVGAIVGSLAFPTLVARASRRTFVAAMALLLVGIGALSTLSGFWIIAGGLTVVGIGSGLLMPYLTVYLSASVPESSRGRAMGIFNALTVASYPVGLGLMTVVLDLGASLTTATAILTLLCLGFVVYAVRSPALRRMSDVVARDQAGPAGAVSAPALAASDEPVLEREGGGCRP